MKALLIVLAMLLGITDPSDIAKKNQLKSDAEAAFEKGQFEKAVTHYSRLYDSLGMTDPSIALNLAHSYYALGDSGNARLKYQSVASGDQAKLKSIAYQQLGVMAKQPQSLNESLDYLKSAIKADPSNDEARYNYEVVKKLIEEQKKQQEQNKDNQDQNQDKEDKDQQNKDQQQDQQDQNKEKGDQEDQNKENQEKEDQGKEDQEQEDQSQENKDSEKQDGEEGEQDENPKEEQQKEGEQKEGEESDEEQQKEDDKNQNMSTKQKLEEMNISEEKAQMILDAMKNNEVQFIQQQKRKATKSRDSSKPDW